MVSSTIEMDLDELVETLRRLRREHAQDREYQEWRKEFPKSWPM